MIVAILGGIPDHKWTILRSFSVHFRGLASRGLQPNVADMTRSTSDQQPLGTALPDWVPPPEPKGQVLAGRYAQLAPLSAEAHAALLFRAFDGYDEVWDYMPNGPFSSASQYHRWVRDHADQADPFFYAIRNIESDQWEGTASYLRIAPDAGSIEVGYISYSPALQRTRAATEAMYLMMKWAFEAGYRRY